MDILHAYAQSIFNLSYPILSIYIVNSIIYMQISETVQFIKLATFKAKKGQSTIVLMNKESAKILKKRKKKPRARKELFFTNTFCVLGPVQYWVRWL